MGQVALYLSGAGSLDGSDVMTSVLSFLSLQNLGFEPVPVGRDIDQGRVVDHRTARVEETSRNALSEAARVVRGNIKDMREIDPEQFSGAVFVGGDGTLSTWTDFHKRGSECRVTERLKHQVLDLYQEDKTLICLGNAGFVLARILRAQAPDLSVNVGSNARLVSALDEWDISITDRNPSWDESNRVGCQPDLVTEDDLPAALERITDFLGQTLGSP